MTRPARDLAWSAGSFLVAKVLALGATVLVARELTIAEFGVYIVQVAIATVLIPVTDVGLAAVVTRTGSRRGGERLYSLSWTAASRRGPLWAAAATISCVGAVTNAWPHADAFLYGVVGAAGQAQLETICGELWGRGRVAMAGALRVTSSALGVLGALLLPVLGASVETAMFVFAASRLVPVLALLPWATFRPQSPEIRLKAGLPIAMAALITVLYVRSDVLLLSTFGVAPKQIAVYGVAYSIQFALLLVPSSVAQSMYPRIVRADDGGRAGVFKRYLGAGYVASMAICACIFLAPAAPFRLFGPTYATGLDQVRALIVLIVPITVSQLTISALQAVHQEKLALYCVVATLLVNVSANVVLIPVLGLRGAVLATSFAELLAVALGLISVARHGFGAVRAALLLPAVVVVAAALSPMPGWGVSLALSGAILTLVISGAVDARAMFGQGRSLLVRGAR